MRSIKYKFGLILIGLHFVINIQAQSDVEQILDKMSLNQALYPPEDILRTKSLVLLSVPMDESPNEWQEILDEMQSFFASVGLDAVAYLPLDRFHVFQNSPQALPEFTFKRGIEHLIILSGEGLKSPKFFAITDFNGEESFYNRGATAFARMATNLAGVWRELESFFRTDDFSRTNMLVNENVEYFYPTLETGVVARSIPPQVAEFKVALKPVDASKYQQDPIFRTQYHYLFKEDSLKGIIAEQNQLLEALSVDSTNTMSLVDLNIDIANLRRSEFIYELKMVKGKEELVNEWINFPDRLAPKDRVVYKFFLDDLRTNTIYIGKEWDASPNWYEALNNFVAQIQEAAQQEGN